MGFRAALRSLVGGHERTGGGGGALLEPPTLAIKEGNSDSGRVPSGLQIGVLSTNDRDVILAAIKTYGEIQLMSIEAVERMNEISLGLVGQALNQPMNFRDQIQGALEARTRGIEAVLNGFCTAAAGNRAAYRNNFDKLMESIEGGAFLTHESRETTYYPVGRQPKIAIFNHHHSLPEKVVEKRQLAVPTGFHARIDEGSTEIVQRPQAITVMRTVNPGSWSMDGQAISPQVRVTPGGDVTITGGGVLECCRVSDGGFTLRTGGGRTEIWVDK